MADDDSFGSLFGEDVDPIKAQQRIDLKASIDADIDKQQRRLAAQELTEPKQDPLSAPAQMVDPLGVLTYQRAGVQHGVFKNLRLGKYVLDARLDLHRLTVEQARQSIYQFILDCVSSDVRYALITHGKGVGRETPALLKSCVAHWLPQFEQVLAFHTAQKKHGGYGATYVLLKKGDKKKLETRERHAVHKP